MPNDEENKAKTKKFRDKLRKSEIAYKLLCHNIPGMVYKGRSDWSTEIISNSKQISGYDVEEFNSKKILWSDLIVKEDKERVLNEACKIEKRPVTIIQQYRIITKDGDIRWIEDHKTSSFIKTVFVGVDGVVFDITDRKQAEDSARQEAARWRKEADVITRLAASSKLAEGAVYELAVELTEAASATLEVEQIGVWLFEEGGTKLVNVDNYVASTGRHSSGAVLLEHEFRNEFAVLKSEKYVDAHDPLTDPRTAGYAEGYLKPKGITSMLDAVIRSGGRNLGTLCFEHVNKPHHWKEDEIAFACQLADQVALALSNHEHKKIEDKLRESEREKTLILDNTGEIIAYHDTNHNLKWANKAYLETIGLSLQELKGRKCYLAWGLERYCNNCPVTKAIETGKPQEAELTPQNQENWPPNQGSWLSRAAPVKDSTGSIIGAIEIAYDITKRKRAESELASYKDKVLKAQKHAYIGSIGSIMAHQVNQPLTVINILLDRALDQLGEASCSPAVIKNIQDSLAKAREATLIIHKLRQYSKDLTPEGVGKVNVSGVIDKIVSVLSERAAQAKIRISTKDLEDLPEVEINDMILEQMLLIIIQNAIEAADGQKSYKLDVTGKCADGNIELQFADDCCGIAPENLDKIFEPFFSTKTESKGLGLGLDIVQQILISCGGAIRVESQLGKGTTFYVTLPIHNTLK